ncbi:MAG: hypothetical protein J0H88_16390 [Sphingomonadales bacterium]|nr:hypothetical protein [Sphingomonadales bacterium]
MTNKSKLKYIVVENAGMVGEADAASFPTFWSARRWMEKYYSADELDRESERYLNIHICVEEPNGSRSYEI